MSQNAGFFECKRGANMTSIPPNININSEQLAIAAGAKQGETLVLVNPQPARLPLAQKKPKPSPETLEQSSESLGLERCSALPYTKTKRKMGVVRLRLARFGRKNAPFYRIHAADSRCPRDGKFLERIGFYDPRPGKDGHKRIALNFERAKYWLSVGAQPSDVVRRIFFIAGLLPRPPVPQMPKKGSLSKGNEGVGLAGVLEDDEVKPAVDDLANLVGELRL